MRIYALLEQPSLELMLRKWVLRSQQLLIDLADIETRISQVPTASRNPAFAKQVTLIDNATDDMVMSIALYDSTTYPIRADSVYMVSPFKQFLQADDDVIGDSEFSINMNNVVARFKK